MSQRSNGTRSAAKSLKKRGLIAGRFKGVMEKIVLILTRARDLSRRRHGGGVRQPIFFYAASVLRIKSQEGVIGHLGTHMRHSIPIILALSVIASTASAQNRPIRFWNLTRYVISEFYLAPAGTPNWGANQCKNDKDGTVDPDERLRITGVQSGTYDARFKDASGRVCVVRNIKVEAGEIFSIEEKELTGCTR